MKTKTKYIVVLTEAGDEELITFPSTISHDVMALAVKRLKDKLIGNFTRQTRTVIAAGFVDSKHRCGGKSTSLSLTSRQDVDTALLAHQRTG
jgi:hypothetical protein